MPCFLRHFHRVIQVPFSSFLFTNESPYISQAQRINDVQEGKNVEKIRISHVFHSLS
jgi:hypothetical protein